MDTSTNVTPLNLVLNEEEASGVCKFVGALMMVAGVDFNSSKPASVPGQLMDAIIRDAPEEIQKHWAEMQKDAKAGDTGAILATDCMQTGSEMALKYIIRICAPIAAILDKHGSDEDFNKCFKGMPVC